MDILLSFILYSSIIVIFPYLVDRSIGNKKNQTIIVLFVAVVCGLIAAFRGSSGTDSSMYISAYNNGVSSVARWNDFEYGFILLIKLLRFFKLPYNALFFIMAVIPSFCILKAIILELDSVDIRVASFIYFSDLFFFGMNGMRQHFAICLCIYAFVLFLNNKMIYAFILFVVSCFFHRSALICIIALFIIKFLKSNNLKLKMIVIVSVAVLLISNRNLLGSIAIRITGKSYYGGYFTRDVDSQTNIFLYYIKNLPLILFPLFQLKRILNDRKYFFFYVLMLLGIIISSLGAVTATQVSRLGMYFSYFKIFVFAYCSNCKTRIMFDSYNRINLNKTCIYLYFTTLFYYNYFLKGFSLLVPYGQPV